MCPGNDESAGKRRLGKTRKGSKWLSQTLVECAKSANRSKNTYLAAQYARLRARRGANKATIAVCHSIPTAAWHMLQTGETYSDPGGDFFARRDPERTRKRLVTQLERLGYTVTLRRSARQPEPDFLYSSSDRQTSRGSSRQIRRHCDLGGVPELARLLEINDVSSERRERNGDDHRRSAT
jgi:Transposase IS116/IS110/IS902 family